MQELGDDSVQKNAFDLDQLLRKGNNRSRITPSTCLRGLAVQEMGSLHDDPRLEAFSTKVDEYKLALPKILRTGVTLPEGFENNCQSGYVHDTTNLKVNLTTVTG
jgi:hypothetical protein